MDNIDQSLTINNVTKRLKAPTPLFFKKLRNIGLILAAVGGALLSSPVALPVAVVSAAGYLLTAGTVVAAVCQTTTSSDTDKK